MPTLKETIAALFERAASGPAAEATVARGLHLKARYMDGLRQLLLSRPDVQPSDLEVATCAKHGGFDPYHVGKGLLWQCITETQTPAHDELIRRALVGTLGDPKNAKIGLAPIMTGQVCGTCANGLPTQYPNEVECQLGHEAHDKQPKGYNPKTKKADIPVQLAHGLLAMPILTPGHRCVTDAWRYRA